MEKFDSLGECPNALLTSYFVSTLRCIALRYTVPCVPFREIVRCSGPFRSVPFREIVGPYSLLPAVFDTQRWRASPVWLLYNLFRAIQFNVHAVQFYYLVQLTKASFN